MRNNDQLIDEISEDQVLNTGFEDQSFIQAATVIQAFKQFINQNIDELSALQILCRQPRTQDTLSEENLNALEESLQQHSNGLTYESLWFAYQKRSPNRVRGNVEQRTDLVSLVRFAMDYNFFLEPFSATVNRNFDKWLDGKDFTPEQREWLEMIQKFITTSLDIRMSDFEFTPFAERGNGFRVSELFGDDLNDILKDLTEKLIS